MLPRFLARCGAPLVCASLLALPCPEAAGAVGPAESALTPESAAREALRSNPDARAARETIGMARGRLVQAGLWPNPELGFVGSDDFAFNAVGERRWGAGLDQRFPVAGRLGRARDVARVDVALALAELRNFERTLIANAQRSVLALLALDRAIAEQTRVTEAARRLAEASARRFRVAEVSEAEVTLLEIERARFEQALRLLELDRRTETMRLNRLLDRPPEAAVSVAGDLEAALFQPLPPEEATALALRRRPDLHGLRLERDRAGAEVRLARAEAWEDWTVGIDYDVDRQVFEEEPEFGVKRDDFLGLALSVPLPLFDRNQGRIATARAEGRRAVARTGSLERAIQMEVSVAARRVEELRRVAGEYADPIVPRASRNVALLERGYREGLAGIAEIVQAEQQYGDVALRYARLLGELRQAEVDLEEAAAASPLLDLDFAKGIRP